MKAFKIPMIATAVALALMLLIGIGTIAIIYNSSGSNRQKNERAAMAGGGVATLGCIGVAPFWLYAAAKVGQERRKKKQSGPSSR